MKRLLSTSKFVAFQALNEKLLRCQSPAELESLILTTPLAMFNDVNCSTAITMLGRRKSTNANAIDTCLFIAKSKRFLPRHLSNICFGIANGRLCAQLPGFLVKQIPANLSSFNTQDLANTLWSLARLQHAGSDDDAELVERFARHLIDKPELLVGKHTDLSLLLWSFVTLGCRNDALFGGFARQITASSTGVWKAHNMANCLWAFATADHFDLDVCELFAREIARTGASEFNPQDLANTIWAFSTLRFKYEPSLVALADKVCKRELGLAPPPRRSRAPIDHSSSPSFVAELMQKLKAPSSVFASSAKHKLPILLERLEGKPPPPQQQLQQPSPTTRLQPSSNCFTPQHLTSTLMSFANLGFYHAPVIESIASEVCTRTLQEFQSQHLFNLLWAFACLNSLELARVKDFFNLLPAPEFEIEYQLEQAQQLFQVHLAWKQHSHRGTRSSALLDAVSDHDWYLALVRQQRQPSSSQVHLKIAQLLAEQFPTPGELVNEASVCGGMSVDILLPKQRYVIEIDGPTHFLHTVDDGSSEEGEEEKSGRTRFKHRLLAGEGYSVCSISVRKFEATPRKRTAIAMLAKGISLRTAV